MELTNTHIKEENVPLFVFETEQKNQREELGEGYIWEEPGQMRSVLGTYEVEGAFLLKYRLSEQRSLNFFKLLFYCLVQKIQ